MKLLALTFVRTIELRGATWAEIDLGRQTYLKVQVYLLLR